MECPHVCCTKTWRDLPLDAVHANATAWYGKMKFDLSCIDPGQTIIVGEVNKRVTVKDFVDAIQDWAVAWDKKQTHPAIEASFMIYDCIGYPGWNVGSCDIQDDASVCALI